MWKPVWIRAWTWQTKTVAMSKDMIITSTIMEIILSPRKEKGTINGISIIQKSAEKHTRRSSVTMVSYCRECLMAMYLSTWIMAKWESVKLPSTLKASLDNTVFIQYVLEVFPCSCAITQAIKAGWPITPIVKSVVDKQASAMFDLVLNRCLVLTAIMTSAFITAVSGQATMLMTAMKISQP